MAVGYWPKTAPINYCEDDYVVTFYVAEFCNTFTNVSYVLAGLNGLRIYRKFSNALPLSYLLASIMFISTGIASGLFHGSLTLTALKMDELSETIAMLCFLYSFTSNQWMLYLHALLASIGIILIETDFCEIHLTIITVLTVLFVGYIARNSMNIQNEKWKYLRHHLMLTQILYASIAGLSFAFDKFACDYIKTTPILNQIEFHAFGWHCFGGLSVNIGIISISIMHLVRNGVIDPKKQSVTLHALFAVLDYNYTIDSKQK
eukprot:305740_1